MKRYYLLLCLLVFFGCNTPPSPSGAQSKTRLQVLRTSMTSDVLSVDPRIGVNIRSQVVTRMLFSGLVRLDDELKPQLELAESYHVSKDFKTYVFTIRNCLWSDGSPITAYDFERSWKAALTPAYFSANTNLFFVIKNAKKAFLGQSSLDQLGVKALDDKTLIIELEQPNSRLLDILINSVFSPVHETMQSRNSDNKNVVCSGPFQVKEHIFKNRIILEKNPTHWNAAKVKLDQLHFYLIPDSATALLLFEKQELDWLGEPLTTLSTDAIPSLKLNDKFHQYETAAGQWLFINTLKFPFDNVHIRKALAFTIDRQKLMRDVLHSDDPTLSLGLIPKLLKKERWHPWFQDNDIQQAQLLFQQGLKELNMTVQEFPAITINYSFTANKKILEAIQQMWETALGIRVNLQTVDGPILFNKFLEHNFEIVWLGWVMQYNNPTNQLDLFKLRNIQPNYTGWENQEFIRYATASSVALEEKEWWDNIEAAEKIFFEEMPSIPISNTSAYYMEQPYVKGVSVNSLLQINFDSAYLE